MTDTSEREGRGHEPGRWWVPDANRDWDQTGRPATNVGKVTIHDVTLREGEQGYGVILTAREMVRIAEELVRVGVPRLEMWPILSKENTEALTEISTLSPALDTYAMVRPGFKEDLDLARQCGATGVIVFTLSMNDWIARHALGKDADEIADEILEGIRLAKEEGFKVVCGPGDAFRTPVARLKRLFTGAVEAGVDSVSVNDSLGQCLPSTFERLTREVRTWVGDRVEIETHCHNDFGMATANTLAGIQGGADIVECAINGVGERAGNASLEEVAVGATILLGADTGLDLSRLLEMTQLASDVTGRPVPVNKAVTGMSLHHIWTSLHAAWRQRVGEAGRPEAWTPFVPSVIGRDGYQVDLGPMAGKNLIRMKLIELELDAPEEALALIRDRVKEEGRVRKAPVPVAEFRRIVDVVLEQSGAADDMAAAASDS
jgi:isopropylmalate/homocitrate/citramalate synthase